MESGNEPCSQSPPLPLPYLSPVAVQVALLILQATIAVVEDWEHVCAKYLFIPIPNTDMEFGNETEREDKMALAAVINRTL